MAGTLADDVAGDVKSAVMYHWRDYLKFAQKIYGALTREKKVGDNGEVVPVQEYRVFCFNGTPGGGSISKDADDIVPPPPGGGLAGAPISDAKKFMEKFGDRAEFCAHDEENNLDIVRVPIEESEKADKLLKELDITDFFDFNYSEIIEEALTDNQKAFFNALDEGKANGAFEVVWADDAEKAQELSAQLTDMQIENWVCGDAIRLHKEDKDRLFGKDSREKIVELSRNRDNKILEQVNERQKSAPGTPGQKNLINLLIEKGEISKDELPCNINEMTVGQCRTLLNHHPYQLPEIDQNSADKIKEREEKRTDADRDGRLDATEDHDFNGRADDAPGEGGPGDDGQNNGHIDKNDTRWVDNEADKGANSLKDRCDCAAAAAKDENSKAPHERSEGFIDGQSK